MWLLSAIAGDIVVYFGFDFGVFHAFLFLQGHLSSSQLFVFLEFLFLLFSPVMYVNEVLVWFEKPTNSLLTAPKKF
jgi:hypothetical protein